MDWTQAAAAIGGIHFTGLATATAFSTIGGQALVPSTVSGTVSTGRLSALVRALEEQYDAFVGARGRSLLASETSELPTADELGAELERFLAEETERRGRDG